MATLHFDLGSPYAYLAFERAAGVLGEAPELEPVLLGAIFQARGRGSWSQTSERADRIAELDRRAAAYGLPPFAWPPGWPGNGLAAMRAVTWAKWEGRVEPFARAAFRRAFAEGRDITSLDALSELADEAGLDGDALPEATTVSRRPPRGSPAKTGRAGNAARPSQRSVSGGRASVGP